MLLARFIFTTALKTSTMGKVAGSGVASSLPPITQQYAAAVLKEVRPQRRTDGEVRIVELTNLWSGLGSIYLLDDEIIYKHVRWPEVCTAPQQHEVESYKAEASFYEHHAPALLHTLGMPKPLLVRCEPDGRGISIAMSRLRGRAVSPPLPLPHARLALDWLATLHAVYWNVAEADLRGLQRVGSYWHLASRTAELERMPTDGWEGRLRLAARALDERLKADPSQTVIHGDSKPANMLFLPEEEAAPDGKEAAMPASGASSSPDLGPCAAVQLFDWQYTGRGCPAKDLANLLTYVTGLDGGAAEAELLGRYHARLSADLRERGFQPPPLPSLQAALELAIADQARWLCGTGWRTGTRVPGTAEACQRRARAVVDAIDGGAALADEAAYVEAVFRAFPVGKAERE